MREAGLKTLSWGILIGNIAIWPMFVMTVYWKIVSPAPTMRVLESFIEEVESKNGDRDGTLHRPGIFRVVRHIESESAADGRITAYFETPAMNEDSKIRTSDGTVAMRAHIQIKIGEDEDHVEEGRQWRTRTWETPPTLPEGDWVYVSVARFCSPFQIRCDYFRFPPIPVRLAGPANPRG